MITSARTPRPVVRRLVIVPLVLVIGVVVSACGPMANTDTQSAVADPEVAEQLDEVTTENNGEELGQAAQELDAVDAADEGEDTSPAEPDEPEPTNADVPQLTNGKLAEPGERTNWSGTIGDDTVFTMWLAQDAEFLRGEIVYNDEPIMLLGHQTELGWFLLNEYGPDGRVSGTITISPDADGFIEDATWDEMPMSLSATGVDDLPYIFDPLVRPGVYGYSYAPFDVETVGPEGTLAIESVEQDSLRVAMWAHRGAPSFNQALLDWVELPLDGNVARYESVENGLDCAFNITVFDGFAFVDYVDDRFDCGFGAAASVVGTYVLDPSAQVPSDLPLTDTDTDSDIDTDAVLTATSFGSLELGQTWATLTSEFGVEPFVAASHDFDGCYYMELPQLPGSPWVMLLGDFDDPNADPADAIVSRIEPGSDQGRTEKGLGVGSTEAEVRAAHVGEISAEPHVYFGDGAEYLKVTPADRAESTLLFETNEDGIVVTFRNGYNDPITWIEGCA